MYSTLDYPLLQIEISVRAGTMEIRRRNARFSKYECMWEKTYKKPRERASVVRPLAAGRATIAPPPRPIITPTLHTCSPENRVPPHRTTLLSTPDHHPINVQSSR